MADKPEPTATKPDDTKAAEDKTAGGTGVLPAQYWLDLEQARAQDDDADSAIGDDGASTTASLSSSILQYRTIHGRTYHSERGNASYWGSNDEAQNESLDIIHHVLTLLLDGNLFRAPIPDDVQKVVDVGTGTGIWAIDFADKYPGATVIGTEVSPIQPSWVPPNVEFQIDDCTQEWTFEENTIDFVHMRWLFGSIKDWPALYREAFRCIKPGGWLESHEASVVFRSDDGSVHEKTAMAQFSKLFVDGGNKMGQSMTIVEDGVQRTSIEAAGFTNIQEENFKSPFGSWPKDPRQKEIGTYQRFATELDTEGSMLMVAALSGWSKEEVRVYLAHLRREWRNPNIHAYYRQKVVWAQKPEA
jgi:ubiquinone/menaquinone biosynthesis C-methylase UbiE